MKYFVINKPYGVLSQFSDDKGRKTFKDIFKFPKGVYPVGRLDMDSEGLLLLTDDKTLTDYLLNPVNKHEREYYVQVEGIPSKEDLDKLSKGILIEGKSTLPAIAKNINYNAEPRIPPIRFRKTIQESWISLILYEGRNRQVRKMTAKIGFPTLRLIRIRLKNIELGELKLGEFRELSPLEIKYLKQ